jgi:hypothetical protein
MRTITLTTYLIATLTLNSKAQTIRLGGEYTFERKGEMRSIYIFSSDSLFISILSGDMGTFYGAGKFKITKDRLILKYDSTGISSKADKKYYILPTSNDTLRILNLRRNKINIECDYTGRLETYKRKKEK